jgi:hypothetical protein
LPSPEQLGVSAGAVQRVDWNALHESLQRLGAVGLHVDRFPSGAYRVSLQLPTGQPERTHHIEAEAATEAEAARLALERGEQWAVRNR